MKRRPSEDRPLIARVIYNRLAHNYPLQIDATHIYNVPPEEIEQEGAITRLRDVDTPWNTFTNTGLPATPIANPGPGVDRGGAAPGAEPEPGQRRLRRRAGGPVQVALLRARRRAGQPRLLRDDRPVQRRSPGRRRRRPAVGRAQHLGKVRVIPSSGEDPCRALTGNFPSSRSGRRSVQRVNVAALIGSPVGHSLSPVIHQAAFDAAGRRLALRRLRRSRRTRRRCAGGDAGARHRRAVGDDAAQGAGRRLRRRPGSGGGDVAVGEHRRRRGRRPARRPQHRRAGLRRRPPRRRRRRLRDARRRARRRGGGAQRRRRPRPRRRRRSRRAQPNTLAGSPTSSPSRR